MTKKKENKECAGVNPAPMFARKPRVKPGRPKKVNTMFSGDCIIRADEEIQKIEGSVEAINNSIDLLNVALNLLQKQLRRFR